MIGASTGQILPYAIRCKKKNVNNVTKKWERHDCRRNWSRTSNIMKEKGFHEKNLVMNNHTKKNFTSKLYDLKKQKKYTLLGPKTLKHLTKYFAVKSDSDNAKLKKNLESIPYYVFGKHENFDEWCKFKENPQDYKSKYSCIL